MPESLGDVTRNVFFEEPEPGKIHVEFEANVAIRAGQQVKQIAATGKITQVVDGDGAFESIGVAVQNVEADERVTVATKGYCIIIARAGAALVAGPVEIEAYDTPNDRPVYSVLTGADDAAKLALMQGYNLTVLAAAGENHVLLV